MKAKAEQKPEQLSMKVADFDRIMGAALQVPAAPRSTTRQQKGKEPEGTRGSQRIGVLGSAVRSSKWRPPTTFPRRSRRRDLSREALDLPVLDSACALSSTSPFADLERLEITHGTVFADPTCLSSA